MWLVVVTGLASCLALGGCSGADGEDGANGTSCTVTDNSDGTKTISCDDGTTATVVDGASCTVADNADGTSTITCDDGTTATVTSGTDGKSCTVADNGDGTSTISCDDGTSATVTDGVSCTVDDDGAGTKTITCDDGTSAAVTDGTDVDPATVDDIEAQLAELSKVTPESCAICHAEVGEEVHQSIYDDYSDESDLELTIVDVVSTDNGDDTFDAVMTFTITKKGMPLADGDGLPSLAQKRFSTATYDAATGKFYNSQSFSNPVATGTAGEYEVTAEGMDYAPEDEDAIAYGYITDTPLDVESGGHISLYGNVSNAGKVFNNGGGYVSAANVEGCEKCHGAPYMKHGYRGAEATNLPNFAACKTCHYDNRTGGHEDWQIFVDDPARYAEVFNGADLTPEEEAKYAYTANIMNDVHMSHGLEFPYPQSMANCATCHEGKLDMILTDEFFVASTCKSCHAVTGSEEYGTSGRALETIWENAGVGPMHNIDLACNSCHKEGGAAKVFSEIHTGYDEHIYQPDGTRLSDLFAVTIDSATFDGTTLTVTFSATEDAGSTFDLDPDDIIPTLMVALYGWDTKDFIVSPHSRDDDNNRLLEFQIDGTTTNPRFTVVNAANGSWTIDVDLSMWSDMITDGTVKRAEIGVMPLLATIVGEIDSHSNGEHDDTAYAVDAPSRTFDLVANDFDDEYYSDIVNVQEGCNNCHDALATTFHSPNRGGNIKICRMCHVTTSGGSHLEMQSRSIDSYVHAIHSFQAFDPGDIDFTDPVEKMRYEVHTEHNYPNFTIKNCESCHNEGMFEVPDQSMSLPGKLSKADTWNVDRNIGAVPGYVTGPASRACGGCHRAHFINEDAAGELAAFNQHTNANGYLVEDGDGVLDAVIDTIMSFFE